MCENPFLKQFVDMRRSLLKEETKSTAPQVKKGKKGTGEAISSNLTEDTLAGLIEQKPGKKKVEEYFQKECTRLTTEKMK